MPATYNNSDVAVSATFVTSLETPAFAVGGSSRYFASYAFTSDSAPVQPNNSRWGGSGGTAMGILQSRNIGSFGRFRMFGLVAPTAQTSTLYVSWTSAPEESGIVGISYTGVDQSTPVPESGNATGTNTTPTATRNTPNSSDLVIGGVQTVDSAENFVTLSVTSPGTTRELLDAGAISGYVSAAVSDRPRSGATTALSWSIGTAFSGNWGVITAVLKASAGQKVRAYVS